MAGAASDNPVHRVVRAVTTTKWGTKAKDVAASLKAQHAAGRAGDESPAEPVWPTPKEQLEALKSLFRASPTQLGPSTNKATHEAPHEARHEAPHGEALDGDAEEVAEALRGVDWAAVRAATAGRTSEVTRTMRAMAEHVDWAKVQPVAAQVSSALIAAAASGRIPVGGRLGPIVARAITDQNNLGKRVAQNLQHTPASVPPDFRWIIEATSREA
jgi:hypothetical protein